MGFHGKNNGREGEEKQLPPVFGVSSDTVLNKSAPSRVVRSTQPFPDFATLRGVLSTIFILFTIISQIAQITIINDLGFIGRGYGVV